MYRHSWKILLIIGSLIAVGSTLVFAKNQPEDINQLLVQGHFWYARGHNNLAINAWHKVLRAEPENSEALAGLEEISEFDPESIDQEQLIIARRLASEGNFAAALAAYKLAFDGLPPTSFHAAEYFETLSGKQGQWKNAHFGLRQLVKRFPSNIEYQLTLGRVESYRETHRRRAIERFESIHQIPGIDSALGANLENSWRNALLWLGGSRKDVSLYERYLKAYPQSPQLVEVEGILNELKLPKRKTSSDAFALLKNGKLNQAASGFKSALRQQPNNADNYEGLGIIRLRQKRYGDAAKYLARAIELDQSKSASLGKSLKDAQYWDTYQQAQRASQNNDYEGALSLTDALLQQRPKQIEGLVFRAQIGADQGDYPAAIDYFTEALDVDVNNIAARAGLISALVNQQQDSEMGGTPALALLNKYQLSEAEYRAVKNRIDASRFRLQAHQADSEDEKLALLNKAMQSDPNNAWIRLDIARAYSKLENVEKGAAVLQQLLAEEPHHHEAAHALAMFHNSNDQWSLALQAIEKIPVDSRSETQQKLAVWLTVRSQSYEASQLLAKGDHEAARTIATKLSRSITDDPFLRLTYAELLLELGDVVAARKVAKETSIDASLVSAEDIDLHLRYALILLKTEQQSEFEWVLAKLRSLENAGNHPGESLNAEQLKTLQALELGSALKRANQRLNAGNPEDAQQIIAPLLEKHHQNRDLQLLQGAIYQHQHHHQKSLALYRNVLSTDPANVDAIGGAYGSAMALKEYPLAEAITLDGLKLHPEQPRLLSQLAKLNTLQGKPSAARNNIIRALEKASDTDTPWEIEARQMLEAINANRTPSLTFAAGFRNRGNDAGLDQLDQRALAVKFTRAIDAEKLLSLGLLMVDLDTESLRPTDSNRYGSLALSTDTGAFSRATSNNRGLEPTLQLDTDLWSFDLGATPSAFDISNLVGGLTWRFPAYEHSLALSVSRRAVKESLLSYAGAFDPQSSKIWGGVTRNGAQLRFSSPYKNTQLYAEAGGYQLRGRRVQENTEYALSGGVNWLLLVTEEQNASIGLRLSLRDFKHNLGFFTLGHGGYFSPSNYASLSIPFEFQKQVGKLSYRLNLAAGIQGFDQAAVDTYPDNPALQASLGTLAATDPTLVTSQVSAETTSSVYTIEGEAGYSLDKRLIVGGWVSINNTDNFDEMVGGLFLRYLWNPLSQRQSQPVNSLIKSEVWQ